MILIGMFDSPFVRRVAVSMNLLGVPFEHRNWSVGKDFELIRQFNPLGRVPALVQTDGDTLVATDEETRQAKASFGSIFARLPGGRSAEIMIRGANHYMFNDDAVLRSPPLMRVLRAVRIVGIDGRRQIAVTAHFVRRAFYRFPSLPINNVEHCAEELTSRIVQSPARQAFRDLVHDARELLQNLLTVDGHCRSPAEVIMLTAAY